MKGRKTLLNRQVIAFNRESHIVNGICISDSTDILLHDKNPVPL